VSKHGMSLVSNLINIVKTSTFSTTPNDVRMSCKRQKVGKMRTTQFGYFVTWLIEINFDDSAGT